MLTSRQVEYLSKVKQVNPSLNESSARTMLVGIGWMPQDVEEGVVFLKPSPVYNGQKIPLTNVAEQSQIPISNQTVLPQTVEPTPLESTVLNSANISPVQSVTISPGPSSVTQGDALKKGNHHFLIFSVVGLLVFLMVGISAYAYFFALGPFSKPPYDESNLLSGIFGSFDRINSTSYKLSLSAMVSPRDEDARPFKLTLPDGQDQSLLFGRDQDRFRDFDQIMLGLQNYISKNKKYPANLAILSVNSNDPLGGQYGYVVISGGKSFALTIAFETEEAANAIKKSSSEMFSAGKTVTFTEKNISSNYYFTGKPQQPVFLEIFGSVDEYANYIPLSLDSSLSFLGTVERSSANADGHFQIIGQAAFEDSKFIFDTELSKIGDNLFARVNKVPSVFSSFVDFSKIIGLWIKMTPQDIANSDYSPFSKLTADGATEEIYNNAKILASEQIKLFVEIANDEKALVINGLPVKEKLDGVSVYKYDLKLERTRIVNFYKRLVRDFENRFGGRSFVVSSPEILAYLDSPAFTQIFDYLNQNNFLTLWADEKGFPVKFVYTMRFVPKDEVSRMKEKQVSLSFGVKLSDINKPIILSEPTNTMSFADATTALTGMSKEDYLAKKEETAVKKIREALNVYKILFNRYPVSLSELTTINVIPNKAETKENKISTPVVEEYVGDKAYYEKIYNNTQILKTVPLDAYTNSPFAYSKSGNGYKLAYTLTHSAYKQGSSLSPLFDIDYSNPKQQKIILRYVEGLNTANELNLSVEVLDRSKIDTDVDGVPDFFEDYIGTNKFKKDTDGDGYSDSQEILSDSNPSGAGRLEKKSSNFNF
ncbi:MAG: hypothetical protein EXS46_00095 [Candidatus Taylorbacteria bacterium]|nr:hypothetical protein [Candidatus Taylorbacteria bacterium]